MQGDISYIHITIFSVIYDYSGETLTNSTIPNKYKNLKCGKAVIKKHSILGCGTIVFLEIILNEGTSILEQIV